MSAEIKLEMVRGEAYVATGTHRDPVTKIAIPVGGWTIRCVGRPKIADVYSVPPVIDKTCTILGDGSAGQYTIEFTAVESALIAADAYIVEVWRTDAGSETQMAHGSFLVKNGAL